MGQQMGLFTGKALNDTPTRDTASAKPVRFNEGEVGELSLGSVSVESYLREMGERDAFAVREVLSVMDFNAMESSYRGGGRPPYGPRQMLGLVLYGVMQGGEFAAGSGAAVAAEYGVHVGVRGDIARPFGAGAICATSRRRVA